MQETDLFKFGKHKGRPLWHVMRDDPDYVAWCLTNLDGFTLEDETMAWFVELRKVL